MRTIFVIFILAMGVGCAELRSLESVQAGPRAGIHFVSPVLEDRFLAYDLLSLLVLEPDRTCTFSVKGSIPLSIGADKKVTYLPANRRSYFRLKQSSHGFMGESSNAQLQFSFVPDEGVDYTIEHIDTPNGFRMKYYKHQQDGKKVPFEVQNLHLCETTSDGAKLLSEVVRQYQRPPLFNNAAS